MKTTEVLDAINALLAAKWPSVCGPHRLRTALLWLAVEKDDWTAANRLLARHDLQLRLTLDDALGGHDAVAWYRLAQETKEAMDLLAPALAVGSRYLKLTRKPREADRTDLQINASWMDLHLSVGTGAETAAKTAQMRVEMING